MAFYISDEITFWVQETKLEGALSFLTWVYSNESMDE